MTERVMPVFKGRLVIFFLCLKMKHFPRMSEEDKSFPFSGRHFETTVFHQGLLLWNMNRSIERNHEIISIFSVHRALSNPWPTESCHAKDYSFGIRQTCDRLLIPTLLSWVRGQGPSPLQTSASSSTKWDDSIEAY